MKVLVYAVFLALTSARIYPVFPSNSQCLNLLGRHKRQSSGFQNTGNAIFFDNDNVFDDFVTGTRGKLRLSRPRSTTPRPSRAFTTVAVPGMGTTRSACEDLCLTTPQYDPVCGDNNVTYMNMARYRCAVRCGQNIKIVAHRACPRV
ncbi:uncharacterized protein [Euwallacea fornicatus]|uniref:uncharacterized protein n=1 Tax=Euwallacea fornicatus TaxID=995702 RepID=UPI00338F203F